ncbi:phenylalanine--tRNA ligase beta subunit [Sulfurimicrobium lacus]|uniref:Phenylalanine--tRNA ligase beta subunit n=1 Tax=Sulfurimicrobium lacus TaxID=2715678 RepID=A0A6F8VEY6_9PROT|nr:phenylalanine--tRNA ligase subunit beta [Sulfurimicrobium lacus]BCB27512.1 phenylalanine--tRNA ligase beta subunit [Sulfurimicrobium lacus]
MKFSENWLRTFVNPALDSDQLSEALTMAGLEVEALEPVAPAFDKIVVAEVLSLEKHPDADRLNVCQVNVGAGETLQIVCGASNVHAGARVPCALVGAELPGLTIKRAKVRGIESFGMLCSAKELGLAEESSGLLLLPSDAPTGTSIRAYLDLDDKLFTLKLTPNRSDCLSLLGVAREVAAVTGADLALPPVASVPSGGAGTLPVVVAEPSACPRYCGRVVRGIKPGAVTPDWMVRRLERCGIRSINPVVDITNYVMLEQGQPLHAFDMAKICGGLQVRFARDGEQVALLNQQVVELAPDMLVVADDGGALALAGIMGGESSAVTDGTTDIFLESAFFDPDVIAGKGRRIGVSTDSSYRFERGVDFASTRTALERASELILDICGGEAGGVQEVCSVLPKRDPIVLRAERARRVLGIDLSDAVISGLLRRLHLDFSEQAGNYCVTPPSYRFDLAIEVDLIEELARLHGYDNIPALPPRSDLRLLPQAEAVQGTDRIRQFLVARDYQEVVTYSFVDKAWESDLAGNEAPVALQNPIASQMSVMRSTLFGGLLDVLRFNFNRRHDRVRIYEIGSCFAGGENAYSQPQRLGGLCYGGAKAEQWGEALRQVDFFDVKADLEALCHPAELHFNAASHPALHPGQSAQVFLDGAAIGWIGTLHPRWQQKYDLPQSAVMFELELSPLMRRRIPRFSEVSKFPPVRRDLAVVVEEGVDVQTLLDGMREQLPESVTDLMLFDVYRGKGIDLGKKSLAFKVLMQDTRKTLTDEEVEAALARIKEVLATRFNATLRA